MSEAKPPLEQLLELMVFGPLGVALAVRDRFPEMAAEGRAEVDRQVRAARMIGTFAVTQARREFDKRRAAAPPSVVAQDAVVIEPVPPIPQYDDLTAAEIVRRLAPLSADDMAAVADYERAHRNRRTILGRIEQLTK